MRVLHCIASIQSSYGGPVAVLRGLCQGLTRFGVSSTILSCSSGDLSCDQKSVLAFSDAAFLWSHPLVKRFYWEPFLTKKLTNELKTFDLLHVHGVFSGLTSGACKAARNAGIPYILEPFGTLSPYALGKSQWLKRLRLFLGERANIEGAASLFFTSQEELQRARLNFRIRSSFVTPNGLDWSEFERLPSPGPFRKDYAIGQDEKIFLFLGRLHPIKGLEVFIPAFIHWRRSQLHSKWRLALIGPDEAGYRKKIDKLILDLRGNDMVFCAGPLYGRDRIQALVDSTVVVLPSFHENFGIAAVEGMACGKPVLVSDHVDICEVVRDFNLGEVAPLSMEGMAGALGRIVMRQNEWSRIGERARIWAKENCDWVRISEIVFHAYEEILSKNQG